MRARIQGYAYLALAMIMVGSTVIASKLIASGLPPFTATAARFAMAFPVFVVLMRVAGTRLPPLARRDWVILLIQAIAGSVGYTTLLISGMRYTTAADAGVIIGTLPVVSALISILVLGERPRPAVLTAIALAAGGVLSIVYRPAAGGTDTLLGNALIFGAVVCESLFILLNKRLRTNIEPLTLSTLMTGIGLVAAAVPAVLEAPWTTAFDAAALSAVAYYALLPTVAGFVLWYAGSARVSGAEASLFTALAPVSALLLAVALLNEQIGIRQVVGVACVLVAVIGLGIAQHAGLPDRAAERA